MSPYPGVGKPQSALGGLGGPGGLQAAAAGALGGVDLDGSGMAGQALVGGAQTPWEGRAIATHKFRLLEFSAYMELQKEEIVSVEGMPGTLG